MEKEFVPYELALELKELGFNEECFNLYNFKTKEFMYSIPNVNEVVMFKYNNHNETKHISAPLYQQAFRWFREKYGLVISIPPSEQNNLIEFKGVIYIYKSIRLGNTVDILHCKFYNSHEEAELECLKKLIKLI
jgi:hypothetical protein